MTKELPDEIREYFRDLAKKTAKSMTPAQRKRRAKKASDAAAKALTPEQRKARAKKAASDRWAKVRAQSGGLPKKGTKKKL